MVQNSDMHNQSASLLLTYYIKFILIIHNHKSSFKVKAVSALSSILQVVAKEVDLEMDESSAELKASLGNRKRDLNKAANKLQQEIERKKKDLKSLGNK